MLLCLNVSYLLPVCINISYHNIAYSTNNVKFNDLYTPEALLMIIDGSALIRYPGVHVHIYTSVSFIMLRSHCYCKGKTALVRNNCFSAVP